jgi:N-acetyl sugar amidotransferase
MKEYQQCTRCIMDNASDQSITFKEDGTCNYCNDTLNRKDLEYFPNEIGKEKLNSMIEQMKKETKNDKYDCMVGLSGGVDSSYIIYLGHKLGLRMLAIHLDDGLDIDIATKNVIDICEKSNTDLRMVKPDLKQYVDLTRSFFMASVPNLAIPQDNLIIASLTDIAKENNIKYSMVGGNFAMESILERSVTVNAADKKHILAIHKLYGREKIDKLRLLSMFEKYIDYKYTSNVKYLRPLNYIDYNLERALKELSEFSGFTYYGGKHYESILTRFMQCYYLPEKYGIDKRKSHYSSLIVSGQMTREEALEKMKLPLYPSEEMKKSDIEFLANYLEMSVEEFNKVINQPPKQHQDYPYSNLNKVAPVARKFRRFLGN